MKIYLAWSGSYSDARVLAAFSDEEAAKKLADKSYEGWTSECELDPTNSVIDKAVWWEAVFGVDGGLKTIEPDGPSYWGDEDDEEHDNYQRDWPPYDFVIFVRALDRDHAHKAAPDRFAQWKLGHIKQTLREQKEEIIIEDERED